MKNIPVILCAVSVLLFSCNGEGSSDNAKKDSATITGPEAKTEVAAPPMDPAAIEKIMIAYATPGDMHKWMAKLNGTWEATVIEFMNPVKPDTSKAINTVNMTLNGLYQVGKFTGKMMGRSFEGQSIMGYDNAKKLFVSTWIDNFGSGITQFTGTYDEKTKTLNLKGHQTDPVSGNDVGIREEMIMIDNDSYLMIMYGTGPDGKEAKFMEGTFRRKK